jgi:hypothetical protein
MIYEELKRTIRYLKSRYAGAGVPAEMIALVIGEKVASKSLKPAWKEKMHNTSFTFYDYEDIAVIVSELNA